MYDTNGSGTMELGELTAAIGGFVAVLKQEEVGVINSVGRPT